MKKRFPQNLKNEVYQYLSPNIQYREISRLNKRQDTDVRLIRESNLTDQTLEQSLIIIVPNEADSCDKVFERLLTFGRLHVRLRSYPESE